MNATSNAKWLLAKGGILGLASFFAFGLHLSAAPNAPDAKAAATNRAPSGAPALSLRATPAETHAITQRYAQLPLAFERVTPESGSPAKFLARGNGYALFLAQKEAVIELRGQDNRASIVRMQLAGANASAEFAAASPLPGASNYFIGNDSTKWRSGITQFSKVYENNVYHGINLVYYGTQGQLEYDFNVAPGADPSVIQLAFQGASRLHVDSLGQLVINSAGGEIRLRQPVAYQEIAGTKKPVAVHYVLRNAKNVSFQVAAYDTHSTLVIDPILIYSTFLGGSNIDGANSIAVAPDKTAFIAGSTFSSDFPVIHALQPNEGGGPDFPLDAFVAKVSSDGSTLLYATYLGGKNKDAANGIAVDNFGNAYVTGYTLSPDFPVSVNSFDTECGADGACGATFTGGLLVSNAFVTKLNAAGSELIYSTFFGYFENVKGQAITVDPNGSAYLTGLTTANFVPSVVIVPPKLPPPPFPITAGAFQPIFGGGSTNAFVAKFDATGTNVLYSSYLGGDTEDVGYGIGLDAANNAYVAGLTYSTNFPTTAGALQAAFGGAGDAFVAKVNTNASGAASLVYSTYLGGAGLDQASGIAVDPAGNAYVAGVTNSAAFGFTPAGVQPTYKGQGDAFVAKLTTTGTLSYFTYLGGTKADAATGVAVDALGNAYVTGSTVSTDFPTAGAVFQPAYGGGNADSFVAKIDPAGATLVYSSFLGGTNTELATGIAVDTDGSAYVTGQTCSEDFPIANPLQSVPGGNCDAYVSKVTVLGGFDVNPAGLVFGAQSLHTTSQPQTVTLTNGDVAQTITSIVVTGANAADFTDTTTCGPPLAVGATCTFTVSFTPSGSGIRKAQIVVTDSAPGSPHIINLTGNTSEVSLSTSSLSFGFQNVGVPSSPQAVTVTNSGTTPLTISFISASGDFTETDNCIKVPLPSSGTCVIEVVFDPTAAIASVGAITISDSGAGSPQVILATGTGVALPPFTLSTPNSQFTVTAGSSTPQIPIFVTFNNFTQAVSMSCSAPATVTCSFSPSNVPAGGAGSFLTLRTALRTSAPPAVGFKFNPPSFLRPFGGTALLWMLAAVLALIAAGARRRPLTASFGFAVVLLLASVACGGGAAGVPAGTPAGTYQITVTGTSGSVNQSIPVTLQVK